MYYNVVVDMKTNFGEKLNEYRSRWMDRNGKNKNAFAKWLGLNPNTVNSWINGGYVPRGEFLDDLAKKIGPIVYEWAGRLNPDDASPLASLPPAVRARFEAAISEAAFELSGRGLSGDEPEAVALINSIFMSHGSKPMTAPDSTSSK